MKKSHFALTSSSLAALSPRSTIEEKHEKIEGCEQSREDGVALTNAILFDQARERLTADQLGPDFFESVMHSVHTSVTEILLLNTKANHRNSFEL